MTEPLKLPLKVVANAFSALNFYVVDADGFPIELTKHQGEVIVAALTADAVEETKGA